MISPEDIIQYGTEQEETQSTDQVDFIAVQLPNPLLRSGIAIIDTPGLGGLYKKHQEITHRYVPRADGVFFVLDSVESLISQDEIDVIEGLLEYTKNIYFVQTKTSLVSPNQVDEWKKRNLEILSDILEKPTSAIPYFTIDSNLKKEADKCSDFTSPEIHEDRMEDLKDSGFSEVYRFLHHYLLPAKEQMLSTLALQQLKSEIASEGSQIQNQVRIVREAGKESLNSIETKLKETLEQLKKWQQTDFREMERRFQESAEDLKLDCRNRIMWKFDPQGIEFDAYLHKVSRKLESDTEVGKQSQQILSDYASHCTLKGKSVIEGYYEKFSTLFETTINESIESLSKQVEILIPEATSADIDATIIDDDAIKAGILQGTMAGGLVMGVCSLYWGPALSSVLIGFNIALPPVLLATAGTILATSIFFGLHGYRKVRAQKLKKALAELRSALGKITHLARQAVLQEFEEISRSLERNARAGLGQLYLNVQNELNRRLEEVHRTKPRSANENRAELHRLSQSLASIVSIDQSIAIKHHE
jgi:hypothetical protein